MTDRAPDLDDLDGERGQTRELAPENHNAEQDDYGEQTDAVAADSLDGGTDDFGLQDSEKVPTGDDTDDVQDVVDHMHQMVTSGRIDNSAFAGEPNFDDNEDKYGDAAREDDLPSDGS